MTHGHMTGTLQLPELPVTELDEQPNAVLTEVNLTTCGFESALLVLVAWACNFSLALRCGVTFESKTVTFLIGEAPPFKGK